MADCECLEKCPFFNDKMQNMPAVAEMYKESYCKKDNSSCARYMVFKTLGRDRVPADLYPNNVDLAREILSTP